jgi:hypothetical protein
MNNVVYDRLTREVTGIDRQPLPFEASIHLPYAIDLKKTAIEDVEGTTLPKFNDEGQPLYLNDVEVDGGAIVVFEEVAYSEKEVDGEIVQLAPATEKAKRSVTYTLKGDFTKFTADEVIEAKKNAINDNELAELVYFDEDLDAKGFSTELASFEADTGVGFVAVHPGGEARTIKLPLGLSAQAIQIYYEGQSDIEIEVGSSASKFFPVVDGVATLDVLASEVYVKFTNLADRKREVHAFGILV